MNQKLLILLFLIVFFFKGNCQVDVHKLARLENKKIKNNELAEVLGLCELEAQVINDAFSCKVYSVLNGPSDPAFEGCNRSTFYYISNATYEIPEKYGLFKIGPFYESQKAELVLSKVGNNFELVIYHKKSGKSTTSKYLIDFNSVKSKK